MVGMGAGAALSLWLSWRFRLIGRLPSAVGMALIALPLLFLGMGASWFGYGISPQAVTVRVVIGFGIGLLLPAAFWRHLGQMSLGARLALALAALAGVAPGWFWFGGAGVFAPGLFALLVGLPAVLYFPVVGRAKERPMGCFLVLMPVAVVVAALAYAVLLLIWISRF